MRIMLTRLSLACLLVLLSGSLIETARAERPEIESSTHNRPFDEQVYTVLRAASLPEAERLVERDHPLLPVLEYAHAAHERLRTNVHDYECVLTKRERVDGRLRPHETMRMKLRHEQPASGANGAEPFAVYLSFLGPTTIKGREVLFVEGENGGNIWVTKGGRNALNNVTLSIDPAGQRAMRESRYPVTEVGMLNLARRLIEEGTRYAIADTRHECQVRDIVGAKINGRTCRYIEVKFPVKREAYPFHAVQVFIDEELEVPVRFVCFGWPETPGETPPLLEEYTYTDIKLNQGLTEADFERTNPAYGFYVPERD